jgi:nucleoside-diphosphate-sugar epimerase
MDFLQKGVHVLCEKPLAESTKEARDLVEAGEKNGAELCVNNTMRTFPSTKRVKEIIESGKIGRLKSLRFCEGNSFAWPSLTGFYVDPRVSSKGILLDLGPHIIDLICWWLGQKPKLIECRDDSFGGPESVARLKAECNGCEIYTLLNRLNDLKNQFQIVGELGSIEGRLVEWESLDVKLNSGGVAKEKLRTKEETYSEFVSPVLDNFLKVIEGKEKPLVSGAEVQDSIEFIEECYERRLPFELPWYRKPELPKTQDGKILVTGASGFIGGRLVECLHLGNYGGVRAGIRQWSSAARLGRFPVDIAIVDLMKKDEIDAALQGVTKIIHCAKGPGGATDEGTRNLLERALERGIERFVHLSTTEVYGNLAGLVSEDSPFQYTGNEYNRDKINAEKACWRHWEKGLPLTVIRPSIVYGPFSKSWSVHFAKMLLAGKWGVYEKYGEGKCNLVYIDDLIKAILIALERDSAIGQAFNIVGPEVVTWNEYFGRFNKKMGLPRLRVIKTAQANFNTVAMEPVRLLGRIVRDYFMGPVKKVADNFDYVKKMMKQTESALKTTPSPDELKLFSKDSVFSAKKAKELLEFEPSFSVDAGLTLTVEWLRHQGFFFNEEP